MIPSGLRRLIISATFLALAALVATLWVLRDGVVDAATENSQRESLEAALAEYEAARRGGPPAAAERIGAARGVRIAEVPSDDSSETTGSGYARVIQPDGTVVVSLTHTLESGERVRVSDVERLRAQVHESVTRILLIGLGVALLVGGLLTFALTRTLVGPARDLTKVADALAAGRMGERTRSVRRDELGQIGRALDRLAEELEERQLRLRAQEDRLTTMLDSMAEAVFVTDEDGMIDLTNDALDNLVELDPIGRTVIEVIRDGDLHDAVLNAIESGEWNVPREVAFSHRLDGHERHFVAQIAPLEHGGGAIGVMHDVSKREAAERLRRDFIANASHELRTPVTAIRGYAETLASGPPKDPAMATRFIDVILRHAHRLEALVDDMVTLSRAESETSDVALEEVNIGAVLDEVVEGLSGKAEAKGIRVDVGALSELPPVYAQARGVDQVLINLVDNAIKYTPEKGRVWIEWSAPLGEDVAISICNSGPEIPAKHLPRLFERFYRVDAGRSREIGGTGLGLAIVKHLVASMGGRVGVESEAGETRFTVHLPPAARGLSPQESDREDIEELPLG